MAAMQDGCLINVRLFGEPKTKVLGAKLSATKGICIVYRSIAFQSRPLEYQLHHLHINKGRMNIN